jgi:hypothetical protein
MDVHDAWMEMWACRLHIMSSYSLETCLTLVVLAMALDMALAKVEFQTLSRSHRPEPSKKIVRETFIIRIHCVTLIVKYV